MPQRSSALDLGADQAQRPPGAFLGEKKKEKPARISPVAIGRRPHRSDPKKHPAPFPLTPAGGKSRAINPIPPPKLEARSLSESKPPAAGCSLWWKQPPRCYTASPGSLWGKPFPKLGNPGGFGSCSPAVPALIHTYSRVRGAI